MNTSAFERLAAALSRSYRLERELGQGGMATVYLAEDLKHKRMVAIKVLKPELAAVLGAERFVQEITTTAALQHPHILPLFDSGSVYGPDKSGPYMYYVMPFIDGETLRAKLDRETQLGIEEAVKIATAVADALDYAHRHGVIHRDIKPENILLHEGRPMVADFGIALAVSAAAGGRMTETGLSLGTPHYMSPEQATAEKEITARSDVYSLGGVLYEMLTGEPPHMGNSAQQIIMKIITEDAQPVTRLRKAVPLNVAAAVAKALEKLPADRFESAKAFAEALSNPAFRDGHGGTTGAPTAATALGSRATVLLGLVAAVLAVALGWALVTRGSPATTGGPSWMVDLNHPDSAGFREGLALAHDGSLILYGGGRPGAQIWMHQAGTMQPTPIAGTMGGCCPALSPDGQRVAFVRGNAVHLIPISGGTSTPIGTGVISGDDLAWTADGYLVGGSLSGGLVRMATTGGSATGFTSVDSAAGEQAHWSPRSLPDGRGVLFTIVPRDTGDTLGIRIGVVGPEGGPHRVLLAGRVAAFAPPGHLLVVRRDGTLAAAPFDLEGLRVTGPPVPLLPGFGASGITTWQGYFAVAGTGRLVFVAGSIEPERELVWIRGADGGLEVEPGGVGQWLHGGRVSRDGRRLALPFLITGNTDVGGVEVRNRQTGAIWRFEDPVGDIQMPAFTSDGRALIFRRVRLGKGEGIFRLEVGGAGVPTQLLADSRASNPSLSPDERILYFLRQGPDGSDFVARRLDQAAGAEQVLLSGLPSWSQPSISPDGRWVAFGALSEGTARVQVRSTDPARAERWWVGPAEGPQSGMGSIRWGAGGQELYFVRGDSMVVVRVVSGEEFAVGPPKSLFGVRGLSGGFDVGPDGQFLFTRRQSGGSGFHLVMIENWRTLLGNH